MSGSKDTSCSASSASTARPPSEPGHSRTYQLRSKGPVELPSKAARPIEVGPQYQADIPERLSEHETPPYETEDELLWDPSKLSDSDVKHYLERSNAGGSTRGEEEALSLLQHCEHSIREALKRQRMGTATTTKTRPWSEEERQSFENGFRLYGKDFCKIQVRELPARSVGELVEYYYLWKKTERHDTFVRLPKKRSKKDE
ncbi:mesoderm induction early response protein 2-like [Amblyomma americanum]